MKNEFTIDFLRSMPKFFDIDFIPPGYFPNVTFKKTDFIIMNSTADFK